MVNGTPKGSAATILLASSILAATRAVIYTEPTVNVQFAINKQIANAFAIADRLISPCSRRDSTSSMVTDPFPESQGNSLMSATS